MLVQSCGCSFLRSGFQSKVGLGTSVRCRLFFFFKQKTAYEMRISDWSSDVCSSDLDCLQELRWLYDRRNLAEARADLAQWLARWSAKYPRLTDWAEET